MFYRITDVVKHLLIINVLVFFGSYLLGEVPERIPLYYNQIDVGRGWLAFFYPGTGYFRPFQIVTHMFMHADIGHLFFNMLGLFFFGPRLEALWGPRRFLFFYFFAGFGALLVHLVIQYASITYFGATPGMIWGASGAVFGVLAGFAMIFPNEVISLIFPPISMKAVYFILIFASLEFFLGVSGINTGIGHFAHLGGAFFGVMLIIYWDKFGSRL